MLRRYVLGVLDTNSYILYNNKTLDGVIIDLGGLDHDVIRFLRSFNINIEAIIATHGHCDHIYGIKKLKDFFNTLFVIHKHDLKILELNKYLCREIGIEYYYIEPDIIIEREDIYHFGSIKLAIIHTPGHTPGSMTIYIESLNTLFTGDTLFSGSIGRTDLPGGSKEKLIQSICKIYSLYSLSTIILPGHGPSSTLENELKYNMFIAKILSKCDNMT